MRHFRTSAANFLVHSYAVEVSLQSFPPVIFDWGSLFILPHGLYSTSSYARTGTLQTTGAAARDLTVIIQNTESRLQTTDCTRQSRAHEAKLQKTRARCTGIEKCPHFLFLLPGLVFFAFLTRPGSSFFARAKKVNLNGPGQKRPWAGAKKNLGLGIFLKFFHVFFDPPGPGSQNHFKFITKTKITSKSYRNHAKIIPNSSQTHTKLITKSSQNHIKITGTW